MISAVTDAVTDWLNSRHAPAKPVGAVPQCLDEQCEVEFYPEHRREGEMLMPYWSCRLCGREWKPVFRPVEEFKKA